jgi:hypothetical protein
MINKFVRHFSLLAILLVTLLIVRHLLTPGFFPIHDTTHVARLSLMNEAIKSGNIPPLWADSANEGYGYPLFHFYAPLAYYFALVAKLVLPSYLIAIKASFVAAFVLAGLGMYRLSRRWGRGVAIIASCAYLLAPYLALNLYVRGALAELWAIAFLPWVFASWHSLTKEATSMIKTAIITTLFLLSHNLIPLITAPFLLAWVILHKRHLPRQVVITSLLTLSLSSFYLFPLLFERGFVQVSEIARTTEYSLHYVKPWQMWNSTWGFGGSAPGVEDGISFKLGKLNIILALAGVIALYKKKSHHLNTFLAISVLVTVFLTTSASQFIWDSASYLQMVQFPWRFLSLISFFLAMLAGFSISLFGNKITKYVYMLIVIASLLVLNLKYFTPQSKLDISDSNYLEGDYISSTLANIVPEYLPTWMPDFPTTPAPDLPLILTGPSTFTLPRAYYPTWQATLSGQPTSLTPSSTGLIMLDVPEGTHDLTLSQSHTLLEQLSLALSLATLITIVVYCCRLRKISK